MKDSYIISTEIRHFIENNITNLDDEIELKDDTNIFESGLVNSLFSMRLLCFIEDKFSISIPDEYIERENFISIEKMQQLVQKIQG
ncbi:acyl carrier protein [Photorhabdus luminescens subsp. luminescens]|uniref:Phosphopantetheine attachment site n=2 Tax=Photorhabdus luminescens TaxID=29488 RepID=A0A1G5R2U4_PHOLU|nr:phosphopantetheine-binding protein [Photorhabdus luminescens]MCW7761559.1 phosphopantetheine-binding protein [Photorhabdus luminescens subsp. venezuelensis]KMW72142.1 acyl carrier protein [Photorhabdus luminescens subsp. luminescens]OWO81403.1 acyl carrier protein [Photorhabdus luminescens]TNH44822.1 acyl carrier protein [Photorhabdus luminescens subsp. sonorensis]SCZ67639.1 Phosphopantetheine attachment site [Photorhabdus luminescens]